VKPHDLRVGAKPRQLPLCEATRLALGDLNRFRQTHLTPQVRRDLQVADGSERRAVGAMARSAQTAHLLHQTPSDHFIETPIDGSVQFGTVHRNTQGQAIVGAVCEGMTGLMGADRFPGQFPHLDGPGDAIKIIDANASCRGRVDFAQTPVKVGNAMISCDALQSVTNFTRRGRTPENSPSQPAQIEATPAHNTRVPTADGDLVDCLARQGGEGGDIERFGGRADVNKMMRNAATLRRGGFGGADVHSAVDLSRVSVDYLGAEAGGDFNRERTLAGAGRADDESNASQSG